MKANLFPSEPDCPQCGRRHLPVAFGGPRLLHIQVASLVWVWCAMARVFGPLVGLTLVSSVLAAFFFLLSCVNCHISRLVDASQIRVSSSRSVKPLSPFGGLCIVQSSMMCCTDWFGAPHSHSEVDFRPHLFMASPNLPTPVRIRL